VTAAIDPRLAAESLIPPRTGIVNYTSNLDRELLIPTALNIDRLGA
jgi:hypothetical protein